MKPKRSKQRKMIAEHSEKLFNMCSEPAVGYEENFYLDTTDYSKVTLSPAFVDKTLLIHFILNKAEKLLITAPRRFGKSTNMDTIKRFVEIQVDEEGKVVKKEDSANYKLFQDLLIFDDHNLVERYFAIYPVIRASFKGVIGNDFDEVLDKFRSVLHDTYLDHPYLLNSDKLTAEERSTFERYFGMESYRNLSKLDIDNGLKNLSRLLYNHFDKQKVFVFIDDYDAPINNIMFEKDIDIIQVIKLLCQIYSETLEVNQWVERALLTGITIFGSVGLAGVNLKKCTFLSKHPFVEYYGLTELEIDSLLTKFKIDCYSKVEVKQLYGGYVSLNGTKLFSTWSVLNYLQQKQLDYYWEQSGGIVNLKQALRFPVVRYSLEKLRMGYSIEIDVLDCVELDDIIDLKRICSELEDPETEPLSATRIFNV